MDKWDFIETNEGWDCWGVARRMGRRFLLIEKEAGYCDMIREMLKP